MDKDARIAELEREIALLLRRLAALEAKVASLSKNSRTSSKPPSSDIVKPPDERPKGGTGTSGGGGSKRKIGGQPGHDKHARVAFPADRIDATWVYDWADAGDEWEALDDFHILQQAELREDPLNITEHCFRRYRHRVTGRIVTAPVPESLRRQGLIGPRLRAMTALLKGQCHVSYRPMQSFYRDVLGLALSTGQLARIVMQSGGALAEPYAQLCATLPQQPVVHMDETGHRERHQRGWLWCAVGEGLTVFKVAAGRGSKVIQELLGDGYRGIVCSDFFSAYRKFVGDGAGEAAYCWAHLIREIRYLTTLADKVVVNWATQLLAQSKRLFRAYHRQGVRAQRRARDAILERVRRPPPRSQVRTLADRIRIHAAAYFRFLDDPRVEPTNNKAERALRHAVIDRRITQGTRGDAGSRWLERFLSIRETCRQQSRPLFDYLVQAITQHTAGQPVPRLV
jgi:transposase